MRPPPNSYFNVCILIQREKLINLKAARAAKKRASRGRTIRKRKRQTKLNTPYKRSRRQMTKRRRTSLTGGTMDVNPQFMHGYYIMGTANTTHTWGVKNPVARGIHSGPGQATVMEVLKIFVAMPTYEALGDVDETSTTRQITFSTHSHGSVLVEFGDTTIFARFKDVDWGAFTPTGSYRLITDEIQMVDLTDGAGHGLLIAADTFYVQLSTYNWAVPAKFSFKFLYRFKNIKLVEYIGIVQSQS